MGKALDAALIDVGGTLWPNSWPFRITDGAGRHQRVAAAMPMLETTAIDALVADLIESSRMGDEARAISTETLSLSRPIPLRLWQLRRSAH